VYISSWSGGKDSCFACYKALQTGYKVTHLVNFISKEYKRVSFHGIESGLIKIQSELAGIPLYQKETTPDNYENEFKDAVNCLAHHGIKGMVFGDLYLEEHRQWVERVCKELGLEAIEPLWERNTEELMQDFINNGFQAVVVSGQERFIDREWIGKTINRDFMEYLKSKPDVDICGENGEYHTFVVSGPLFRGRIEITEKEVISRNGYWFLDIKDFRVVNA
jgi:uncharacterized protein (TIGR00290 family)